MSVFPPTYLTAGDEDSLLPHTLEMAGLLAAAGVPTTASIVAGMDHAFLMLEHKFEAAADEMQRVQRWLRAASERVVAERGRPVAA
jgi:acetyl esterase/lipase